MILVRPRYDHYQLCHMLLAYTLFTHLSALLEDAVVIE
jgi:hypothetical protein